MSREKRLEIAVFLLRVVAGFLFIEYGGMKLFGWFGNTPLGWSGMMGIAGILEFFGGIAILLGLWVRPIAFILSGEMAAAYFIAHASQGYFYAPPVNDGTASVLFCFIFLFFAVHGAGKWSLDKMMKK